jgi:hypothetical protein
MTGARPPFGRRRSGRAGCAIARLCLGILGALLLLAAPLCVAQAQADDCASMSMDRDDTGADKTAPASKGDCAVGCRPISPSAPVLEAPLRVAYEIRFDAEPPAPAGIVVDPPVPPPRRAARPSNPPSTQQGPSI